MLVGKPSVLRFQVAHGHMHVGLPIRGQEAGSPEKTDAVGMGWVHIGC